MVEEDFARLESIARELLRCDQDLDQEEITRMFRYETGREPEAEDLARAVAKVIRQTVRSW